MLNPSIPHTQSKAQAQGWRLWYQDKRPAVQSAGWFWLFFLLLTGITLFTGWASRPVTLFLELILSLGAGVLAAWLRRREWRARAVRKLAPDGSRNLFGVMLAMPAPRYVRMGTLAGFFLSLTTALAISLLALLVAFGSAGLLAPLMIPYYLFLPVELGACSLAGGLGAWIFQTIVRN